MSKFKCDMCPASFSENRHLGRHKQAIHGIAGKGRNALQRQKAKTESEPELRTLTAPEPKPEKKKVWQCQFCAKAPYTSDVGLREHIRSKHPEEDVAMRARGMSPMTGKPYRFSKTSDHRRLGPVVFPKNGHKPASGSVSLDEAIQVLQVEVDTMLQVITRLKLLQGR